MEPKARAKSSSSSGLWVVVGMLFMLLTIAGIVLATPVGVALGIRSAPLGSIELRTEPSVSARIELDDVYRGVAPLRMEGVRSGPRRLSIEADGYLPVAKEVDVQPGATKLIEVALVPDRPHSELTPSPTTASPNTPATGATAPATTTTPALTNPGTSPTAPVLPSGVTAPSAPSSAPTPGESHESSSSRRRRQQHRHDVEAAAAEAAAAKVAAAPTPAAVPAGTPGTLVVNSVPWAYVWVDGRDTGRTTPLMGYTLNPGPHEVQLRTAMGQVHTQRVQIAPGQTARITRRF
jgi:serine/threonine-protein kinase